MNNELATTPGAVGMEFQDDLPFEDWQEIGKRFGQATNKFSWALGDWLVYGGSRFKGRIPSEIYEFAEKETGIDRASLLSLATVCRRIPHEMRIEGLSFEHHKAIASAPREEVRESWLRFMSSGDLRPSKKLLKLSLSCFPNEPKLITRDEYKAKKKKSTADNYIPHLVRLLTNLRQIIPVMNEDQKLALKADTKQLRDILNALHEPTR